MTRSLAVLGLLTALLMTTASALGVAGRAPLASDPGLQTANLAWERGDYITALSAYLKLLDAPDGDAVVEEIALQTGELYKTTELTADGAEPQFSPDGRYLSYESGSGSRRVTRIAATAEPARTLAELKGDNVAFSPDGTRLAYLRTADSAQVTAAQAAVDTAAPTERAQRLAALNELLGSAAGSTLAVRDVATGREIDLDTGTLSRNTMILASGSTVVFTGAAGTGPGQIYSVSEGHPAVPLLSDGTDKQLTAINSTGTAAIFTVRAAGAGRGGRGGGRGAGAGGATATFGVLSLPDGRATIVNGSAPSFSGDGRSIVFVARSGEDTAVMIASTADPAAATVVRKGPERMDAPAASPDGSRVAFQMMTRDDWDIYTTNHDGSFETRLTHDIQHDLLPQFLGPDRVLSVIGEPRHRRSFLYDVQSGVRTRLFHNNTVRTIAPEYLWKPSADGSKILIVAERDGDTVSPERGVYLMDLSRKVSRADVRARVASNLAAEEALRAKAKRLYAPLGDAVKAMVAEASVSRIYGYEKALYEFDSKHISRPGNKRASAYLFDTYKSFGYAPEFQWFDRSNALGGQTANVVATLKGTVNPELIYVVSSHYDSVAIGPGADDDSSGTAALLETARIMATRPQPATIMFASFTGEEAGLLGSREFVRRAVAEKLGIVGALNNDMVGWANDQRLDNTIRYSNPGIRDVQHAAAMLFTNLITYDALYYKGTDAAAYYEAFGDIVGGIGSYPVLSSPHYHQSHDILENMNHQLIAEVAKTTAATLMLLASSPSRLVDLKVDSFKSTTATISWKPSPESGVTGYVVSYGPSSKPEAQQIKVAKASATLTNVAAGTVVAVKAVNAKGVEGWDWARVTIRGQN
jgi:hypothetical protein